MSDRLPRAERRRWPVGHDPRRERRRAGAEERAAARAKRSPEEQLVLLEKRRGVSARERARLIGVAK